MFVTVFCLPRLWLFVNPVVLITAHLVLYLGVLLLDFELCGCILV